MSTVLLINFSPSEGEAVTRFLTKRRYTCLSPVPSLDDPSLFAFFEKEAYQQTQVDVAIIHLSGESAFLEKVHIFLMRIRELNATTCVILSGNPIAMEELSALLRGGVYDYLRSPLSLEKLDNTIEQGLQTREHAEEIIRSMAQANERLLAEKDQLQIWTQDLSRIYQINQTLASFLNPGLTISAFSESLKQLIPYDTLSVLLKGRGGADRVWVFPNQGEGTTQRDSIKEEANLLGQAFSLCHEKAETRLLSDGSEVLIPLVTAADQLGILRITRSLHGTHKLPLNEYETRILLMVTTSLSLSLRNAEMYQRVKELAATDELTHILNRRAFLNILERELKRSNRLETKLALLLIDLDHFKEVNDLYGHLAGDAALQEIAFLLKQSIREIDILARYGGEEFVIILPEVEQKEAYIAAERIRSLVGTHIFRKDKDPIHITISIGMAIFPLSSTKDPEDLFHLADLALYLAKKKGRNRIEISPPDVENTEPDEGVEKTGERTHAK